MQEMMKLTNILGNQMGIIFANDDDDNDNNASVGLFRELWPSRSLYTQNSLTAVLTVPSGICLYGHRVSGFNCFDPL